MGLALGKEGDEGIGTCHFFAARRLHMNNGALNDAVEPCGRACFLKILNGEGGEVFVQIASDVSAERNNINIASRNNGSGILIIEQCEQ